MAQDPPTICSCCGTAIDPADRFDIRLQLPDVAFQDPDRPRRSPMDAMLLVKDRGAFLRVLLPVRLANGAELVFGTWLRIPEEEAKRTFDLWNDAAYADLVLHGTLANAIKPWGSRLLDAPATATVRETDEIPYISTSTDPYVTRLLTEEWHHDRVLERMPFPLPYAVQSHQGHGWTVERSPGFSAAHSAGYDHFTTSDRQVRATVLTDPRHLSPEESFQALTRDIAPVADEDKLLDRSDDEIRYAETVTTTATADDGEPTHVLYGLIVRAGSALDLRCHYRDPADRAWALHVWRSVRQELPVPGEEQVAERG